MFRPFIYLCGNDFSTFLRASSILTTWWKMAVLDKINVCKSRQHFPQHYAKDATEEEEEK